MRNRFERKVVLITGAASGIGRSTARAFASEGAHVFVADIDESGGAETTRMVSEDGGDATFVRADVADAESVSQLMDAVDKRFGRLDVLHNNAFWAPLYRSVVETSNDEWERTIAVTLTGVFHGCKYGIPLMLKGGGGAIVNTASTAAVAGGPRYAAYIAAKGGVAALTRSVAIDYGKDGIRCNSIAPGFIKTPANEALRSDREAMERLTGRLAIPRIGAPEDIADAALFLASDESSFMTGHMLSVDGGRLIS